MRKEHEPRMDENQKGERIQTLRERISALDEVIKIINAVCEKKWRTSEQKIFDLFQKINATIMTLEARACYYKKHPEKEIGGEREQKFHEMARQKAALLKCKRILDGILQKDWLTVKMCRKQMREELDELNKT